MDVFEYYDSLIQDVEAKWQEIEINEEYIKDLIDGFYNFNKADIFNFIKSSLPDLFDYYSYETLTMILKSEYWQVFEPNYDYDCYTWDGYYLIREYCFKCYYCDRDEFMELLCEKINFSKSLHWIEKCYKMNTKKRSYSELECGYKILHYSNVKLRGKYVVDEYFYDFIKKKYYSPPLFVNYSNKRRC